MWFEFVKNPKSQEVGGKVEVFLYSEITDENVRNFCDELAEAAKNNRDLCLRINSRGGSINAAITIANAIARYPYNTEAVIDGLCASSATLIALAADEVTMPANASMMIHGPTAWLDGSAEEHADMAETLNKYTQILIETYRKKATVADEIIQSWMQGDHYFTAVEAHSAGLVDRILPGSKAIAAKLSDHQGKPITKNKNLDIPSDVMSVCDITEGNKTAVLALSDDAKEYVAKLEKQVIEVGKSITSYHKQMTEAKTLQAAAEAKVAEIQAAVEKERAAISSQIAEGVKSELAALGVSEPVAEIHDTASEQKNVFAQWKSMKRGPDAYAFYKAHRKQIESIRNNL